MNYIPKMIIEELNKLPVFSMLNKQGTLMLLEALTTAEYRDNYEIYEKLISQFRKLTPNISPGLCVQALKVVHRLI